MKELSKQKQRQNFLLEIIKKEQMISTSELSKLTNCSYPTLCRDLQALENAKQISHFHGGVQYIGSNINQLTPHTFAVSDYYLYETRKQLNQLEKREIGKAAASLVQTNDIIFISHGTTTSEFARALDPQMVLTVITDGLDIINIFQNHPNVRLYTTGGTMNYSSMQIEHNPYISCDISNINLTKIFIGVGGFSFSRGVTFYDFNSFEFLRQIIPNNGELIVLADSTKFESVALANFINIDQISMLVTDWTIDPAYVKQMEAIHLPYLIAPKPSDYSAE